MLLYLGYKVVKYFKCWANSTAAVLITEEKQRGMLGRGVLEVRVEQTDTHGGKCNAKEGTGQDGVG